MQAQAPKVLRSLVSNAVVRRNYHDLPKLPNLSYDMLPQPQGCWKTNYEAKQRKYNAHLIFGISFAIGTIVFGKASGLLYFNYNPPARPADKNDYQANK